VRSAPNPFTLSRGITFTVKLIVKVPCDKQETLKITGKPVYAAVLTTVSMQEFIPLHGKIIKTGSTVGKNSNIKKML
jgi:hypothetical protein